MRFMLIIYVVSLRRSIDIGFGSTLLQLLCWMDRQDDRIMLVSHISVVVSAGMYRRIMSRRSSSTTRGLRGNVPSDNVKSWVYHVVRVL